MVRNHHNGVVEIGGFDDDVCRWGAVVLSVVQTQAVPEYGIEDLKNQ